MPVRVNGAIGNFKVKADIGKFQIMSGNTVQSGDMLQFVFDESGNRYITNEINVDEPIDAIARFSGTSPDEIPVYTLIYRARYNELLYTYTELEQFTYEELRTKLIVNYIV